jgi:hypothetical protein
MFTWVSRKSDVKLNSKQDNILTIMNTNYVTNAYQLSMQSPVQRTVGCCSQDDSQWDVRYYKHEMKSKSGDI